MVVLVAINKILHCWSRIPWISASECHNLAHFVLQKTHFSVVTVTQRAEAMLQQQHYNGELVRAIAENVTLAWQQLMYHAEERQKLVMASTNWYKTAEQVRSSQSGYSWSESSRSSVAGNMPCVSLKSQRKPAITQFKVVVDRGRVFHI